MGSLNRFFEERNRGCGFLRIARYKIFFSLSCRPPATAFFLMSTYWFVTASLHLLEPLTASLTNPGQVIRGLRKHPQYEFRHGRCARSLTATATCVGLCWGFYDVHHCHTTRCDQSSDANILQARRELLLVYSSQAEAHPNHHRPSSR